MGLNNNKLRKEVRYTKMYWNTKQIIEYTLEIIQLNARK